ncbi:MAG: substrate-binding domain-containing protein [Aminipila sp.]
MLKNKSKDASETEISKKKVKKGKKVKKPKLTPEEKAIKKKQRVEKQSAATIKKAQDRVKKAEQAIKNVEKAAQKKEKDKEKKTANKIKKEEKKIEQKIKRKEEQKEQKTQNRILKQERKLEERAEKVQRKAELAARTPIQKKVDRRIKMKRVLLKLLLIFILAGVVFAGVKFTPVLLDKLNVPEIKVADVAANIKDKIPFLKKEEPKKAEAKKDSEKGKDEKTSQEKPPEEIVEDDPTLYISGTSVLKDFYTESLSKFLKISKKEAKVQSVVSDTYSSYTNLINGDEQVIFAAFPTDKETKMAEMAGVDLHPVPIMNGGFVFFVNKDNPIKSLTITQLYNIYAGTITNWKQLGGKDEPIVGLQRSENSGSQIGMYRYIISQDEIYKVSDDMKISETKGVVEKVSSDSAAIGYSYYYYMENLKDSKDVKMIAINGVKPNEKTIATAEYPLTTYSYAIVTTEENTKSLEEVISSVDKKVDAMKKKQAQEASPDKAATDSAIEEPKEPLPLKLQFIEWILSEEGQKLVEDKGFIRHDDI